MDRFLPFTLIPSQMKTKKRKTKAKVKVYASPTSGKVLHTFNSIEDLEYWIDNERPENFDVWPEMVTINGCQLLGWDEIYDFA